MEFICVSFFSHPIHKRQRDSHFNESHFYAKCFSLWHYNPLKNTTYHRIMNTIVMYFCGTRVEWIMEHETAGFSPVRWPYAAPRIQIRNGTLTKNEEKRKKSQSFAFVSWVIDKYINYGQLVLMLSDHDSIATGAWAFARIILSAKDFSSLIPYLPLFTEEKRKAMGVREREKSARKRQEVKTR